MCLTPLTLARGYDTMSGNKTDIVPCGKCLECLRDRQHAWAFRLNQQIKVATSACMITFTYEQQPLSFNGLPTLKKKDLQDFWKRLRKHPSVLTKIKYFACGEYGEHTKRPHYHAIVYNLPQNLIQNSEIIARDIWKNGHIHILPATQGTMYYTCKYILKGTWQPEADFDDRQPQFSAMSKNLGQNYLTPQMVKYHVEGKIPYIRLDNNTIQKLPRYYKDKIFSKSEKREMALEAKKIHELDLNQWINYDFDLEVQYKKRLIDNHLNKENYGKAKI